MKLDVESTMKDWAARIQSDSLAHGTMLALQQREDQLARHIVERVQKDDESFDKARDPVFFEQAVQHVDAHMRAVLALATLRPDAPALQQFEFVRQHAIRRARQNFPLAAMLHAYRMGQYGIWQALKEMILTLAENDAQALSSTLLASEYLMAYNDIASMILAEAYAAEGQRLATLNAQTHIAAVEDLLRGLYPQGEHGRALCERNGVRQGMRLAVGILRAEFSGVGLADRRAALQALTDPIERSIEQHAIGKLMQVRNDEIVIVVTASADPGARLARALRARRAELGSGPAGRVNAGIGLDVVDVGDVPQSYLEAQKALDLTTAVAPIVHLAEVPVNEYLLRRAEATAFRLIPSWAGRLLAEDDKARGELTRTVLAFAESSLNVKRTAKRLKLHANTVYFRLNRVQEITGVDPRSFDGLTAILTALRLLARERPPGAPVASAPPPADGARAARKSSTNRPSRKTPSATDA